MTARAASAHAMLEKMVGSRHYAVRVPIPSDFDIGTVSCVHVYACFVALRARSLVVYRPVRFSCSDIWMIVHSACDMWGAQSHTSLFLPKAGQNASRARSPRDAGHFPPKWDCPAQSGTVGQSATSTYNLLLHTSLYQRC